LGPLYINFYQHEGNGWWGRRTFLRKWRRIYADDQRWLPPYYPALVRALQPGNEHLERLNAQPIYLEALPRSQPRTERGQTSQMTPHGMMGSLMEEPVAATVVMSDPRRRDRTGYLALLQVVNSQESLERLLDSVLERLWKEGIARVIGPTGLTPHLQSGVLQNHFNSIPPLHTAYNPPYLPELMDRVMHPIQTTHLYHIDPATSVADQPTTDLEIEAVDMVTSKQSILSILEAVCDESALFPAPDPAELQFLLDWVGPGPLSGWIAHKNGQAVGAALVQPDGAGSFRRARGGANPLWRMWLNWHTHRPTKAGRLLWAGVLPAWRRQGIGRALWAHLLAHARSQEWTTLSVGPLPQDSTAARFLSGHGAAPKQSYSIYASSL